MLASVSEGSCVVRNILDTGDCRSTRQCLERLGVSIQDIEERPKSVRVEGKGLRGYREPSTVLDAGNSGTTIRLMSGLLAGLPLYAVLTGDDSLLSRPMQRVIEPLASMGARIVGRQSNKYAPLSFLPGNGYLAPGDHRLPVASAQVKSALLLAALRGMGESRIAGRIDSRDHTERMFRTLGLPLRTETTESGPVLLLEPCERIPSFELTVPGDISSAAFFIAAALISGRELEVRDCGLNPTRTGFLQVLKRMGADLEIVERQEGEEPVGTILVKTSELHGADIEEPEVPALIDEIPLIAVLGYYASGVTKVRGAEELRYKESDRLQAIARMIRAAGGSIELVEDGFTVEGCSKREKIADAVAIDAGGDHRIAMAAAVLGAGLPGGVAVEGVESATVSFPDFLTDYRMLGGLIE